jgi:hypothetical protein
MTERTPSKYFNVNLCKESIGSVFISGFLQTTSHDYFSGKNNQLSTQRFSVFQVLYLWRLFRQKK